MSDTVPAVNVPAPAAPQSRIPAKDHPDWARLVKGELPLHFSTFAGNLLISQCNRALAQDAAPDKVRRCIDEVHAFFSKYESLYADELLAHFQRR